MEDFDKRHRKSQASPVRSIGKPRFTQELGSEDRICKL